ncbi:MAG: FprA family A-type flavoprotein [Erysipelothrix sp.]|nr:FprA family A-type flavoprotein [Erysipelothrix sp.]
MKTIKIQDDITWVGVLDPDLRIFDVTLETELGTTYNSYVLKGTEKTVVFDTAKGVFKDEYLEKLAAVVDYDDIDVVVVHHVEPDHSGSLEYLLEKNPNIEVYGTPASIKFLADIINKPFKGHAIRENETLSIGNKTLRFITATNLHWPDGMYTYIEEDKILVSCDSFGAHYSFAPLFASKVENQEDYDRAMWEYYYGIMHPFRSFVYTTMKKIEPLAIDLILTGHGPVVDTDPRAAINKYLEWSTPAKNEKKTVIMPYVSAYGYTKSLAEAIKEGLETEGIAVEMFDMVETDVSEIFDKLIEADGILLGSPTIVRDALKPIWEVVSSMTSAQFSGKLASAFGSFGWSGEAVPHLTERLNQLKMKVVEGLTIKFKPDAEKLATARSFGENFGQTLKQM